MMKKTIKAEGVVVTKTEGGAQLRVSHKGEELYVELDDSTWKHLVASVGWHEKGSSGACASPTDVRLNALETAVRELRGSSR